ncbi:MAG: SurA N-terminal domain-containing protein [Verrucomicrobiota bacterium]
MIENLRKYTGLMIATFVILFISFFFLDSQSMQNFKSGTSMFKINGRTYSDKEYNTLGAGSFELASMLAQSGDYSLYQFIMGLSSGASSRDDAPMKFFTGRMILRQAMDDYGVHPSDAEVTNYLRTMRVFNGPDQKFSAETYQNFITRGMGRLGLSEKDLRMLAEDILAMKKINAIVGSGLESNSAAVAANMALENQRVSGSTAKLALAPFEEKIEPTEEEIKTYWETVSDSFTTEPRRKFTYLLASPVAVIDETPEEKESIADATASEEAKKAAAAKKEEEKAKRATEMAEKRRKAQFDLDTLVSDFVDSLEEDKGAGFEELAKEYKWDVKTTELFPLSAVPKELDLSVRFSSQGGKVADQLFKIVETSDPLSKISEAIPVGENQWIIARVDEEEKSRAKTFEEARAEARAQYISEKASEALKTAANENITKLKAAITAGKSFADAAKEVGLTEIAPFTDLTRTTTPDGATQPQNLFETVRTLDPGSIAEVIMESDRAFIVHLDKREVVKEADQEARIKTEVASRTSENETIAFVAWIAERIRAAQVQELFKR